MTQNERVSGNQGGDPAGISTPGTAAEIQIGVGSATESDRRTDSASPAANRRRKQQPAGRLRSQPGGADRIGVGAASGHNAGSGSGSGNGLGLDPTESIDIGTTPSAGKGGKRKAAAKAPKAAAASDKPVKLTPEQTAFQMLTALETITGMLVNESVPMQPVPKALMAQSLANMMSRMDDEAVERFGKIADPLVLIAFTGLYAIQVVGVVSARRGGDESQDAAKHESGNVGSAYPADDRQGAVSADGVPVG